jgi:hypothetical protein
MCVRSVVISGTPNIRIQFAESQLLCLRLDAVYHQGGIYAYCLNVLLETNNDGIIEKFRMIVMKGLESNQLQ